MISKKFKEAPKNLSQWLNSFDLEQTRAGVQQESRARILLVGLPGAGKSALLNQLCGWTVSTQKAGPANGPVTAAVVAEPIEDFGLFCLVDLPQDWNEYSGLSLLDLNRFDGYSWPGNGAGLNHYLDGTAPLGAPDPLGLAEGANLLVYVLDGAVGVQPADYRWIGRLRRLGIPLLAVLNKCDLIDEADLPRRQREIETRLGTEILWVSALDGTNITAQFLPKMTKLCPTLTVALGRELGGFRSQAAARLIQRAAMVNGLVGLEPIPLLDLPVQITTLTGLMLRIAALYDRPASDVRRREVVVAVVGGLAGRYAAQQLAKLVPVVGWLASGIIGWSCTWGLGRAVVAYFEAGGDDAVDRSWSWAGERLNKLYRNFSERRPRLRLRWKQADPLVPLAGPDWTEVEELRLEEGEEK